jgi:hypothetical protein
MSFPPALSDFPIVVALSASVLTSVFLGTYYVAVDSESLISDSASSTTEEFQLAKLIVFFILFGQILQEYASLDLKIVQCIFCSPSIISSAVAIIRRRQRVSKFLRLAGSRIRSIITLWCLYTMLYTLNRRYWTAKHVVGVCMLNIVYCLVLLNGDIFGDSTPAFAIASYILLMGFIVVKCLYYLITRKPANAFGYQKRDGFKYKTDELLELQLVYLLCGAAVNILSFELLFHVRSGTIFETPAEAVYRAVSDCFFAVLFCAFVGRMHLRGAADVDVSSFLNYQIFL